MDDEEFKAPTVQRVYQYLRRHAGSHNLDTFSYQDGSVEGNEKDCLKIILRLVDLGLAVIESANNYMG